MKPDNPTWIACGTTRCPRWRDENCKHDAGEAQFVRSKPAGVGNRQRRVVVIARITPFDSSGSISVTATTGTLLTPRIKSRTIGQPPVDANRPVCAISNAGDHQQEQLVPPTEPSESHRRIQRCTASDTESTVCRPPFHSMNGLVVPPSKRFNDLTPSPCCKRFDAPCKSHLNIVSIILMAAGPTSTTKMPGKMNRIIGMSICTAVF